MSDFAQDNCRSCSAPIIWCETERGKSMPINAEPEPGGTLAVDRRPGRTPIARVVDAAHQFGRTDLRKSHFATCPQSGKWRQKRGAA